MKGKPHKPTLAEVTKESLLLTDRVITDLKQQDLILYIASHEARAKAAAKTTKETT
jgi:hypothetical protein